MRSSIVFLPIVLIVAGCQPARVPENNASAVDINAAAEQAQGDIDTYASNALQTPSEAATAAPLPPPEHRPSPAPTPSPSPAPLNPPAPGEPGGLPDDRTPISEAPFAPDSAQGAANVVQTYYALIEGGKYRQAWALWGNGGKASGMSADAFARSFGKYSEYHANIGAPGRIDAGTGQRFVSVPVQIYGRMKDSGAPFNMRGDVTLHRTADIDGATAEQKTWRISATNIKPSASDSSAPKSLPADEAPAGAPPPGNSAAAQD